MHDSVADDHSTHNHRSRLVLFIREGQFGGTYAGLIIGHTIIAIPYVVITMMAVLKNYDARYDSAAWSLGASRLKALRYVTFPIVRTGMISAFLFAFITSFDELTIAIFVTGGLTTTLPKQMWDDAILSVTPTLAAVSTVLLIFITLVIVLVNYLQNRRQVISQQH